MKEFLQVPKFEANDNKNYKVKTILNNAIYTKKVGEHLLRLSDLIV